MGRRRRRQGRGAESSTQQTERRRSRGAEGCRIWRSIGYYGVGTRMEGMCGRPPPPLANAEDGRRRGERLGFRPVVLSSGHYDSYSTLQYLKAYSSLLSTLCNATRPVRSNFIRQPLHYYLTYSYIPNLTLEDTYIPRKYVAS